MTAATQPGIYRWGPEQPAPTVVLLHSSQSASSQWRALVQQLANDYQVIAVDLLGYGQAPQPQSRVRFRLADEIPRVAEAVAQFAGEQPVILVGHSYGGALALKIAKEQPFAVAKVAVYEPVAFHVLPTDSPGLEEILAISEAMRGRSAEDCTRTFVDYWNASGYFDALPSKIQQLMIAQAEKVSLDFDALLNEPAALEDYAAVQQPLLLLRGAATRRSAKAVAAALETVLPNYTEKMVEAGHMGPLTHPAEVNHWLSEFIAAA
ncbi:alpha/beta hydrolase [Idiomarina tyrosinivorans]|uniref:Alpha/beta hydrolase n=1 Tax=Idiomarina tyrosinivorans TaxID=1445662 RepID=A0A432ZLB3_9GAMM|nr:alpha/beta hydrolase [Idiomarina tyrosinivorans]RUO78758.1 alpha/beta hydrolase [Idiomarina tyrosinivorans]